MFTSEREHAEATCFTHEHHETFAVVGAIERLVVVPEDERRHTATNAPGLVGVIFVRCGYAIYRNRARPFPTRNRYFVLPERLPVTLALITVGTARALEMSFNEYITS